MHTECYIKANGYNPKSHKHAVFNILVSRHFSTPLEQTEYTKGYELTLNTTEVNCLL